MAQFIDERPYSGGLDLDSDERLIKAGDYPFGKNGRSGTSDQNYKGSVEGIRGNILRNTFADTMGQYPFPSGTNKIIGSIEDVKNQTIIYFLWNSNNLHRIIRYYLKEKVIRNVVPATWGTSALNFQRYSKIWNGKIVYAGEQDYIIWTDGVNPQRKIRLDIGSAYPLAPGILVPQTIDFAKQPPQLAPTTSLVTSTVNTFTAGKGFQFALRYVYDDNSITTLSPYSDIQFVDVVNRSIRVSFSSGHFTVKEIQVLAREGNGVSGEGNTNPTWYVVEKRTRPSGVSPTTLTYDFTNTELKQPVARIDSDKLFESIPELAGCMELSETNQVIFADITEGKNNLTISNDTNGITVTNFVNRTPQVVNQDTRFRTSPQALFEVNATAMINVVRLVPLAKHTPFQDNELILNDPTTGLPNNFNKITYSPIWGQTKSITLTIGAVAEYENFISPGPVYLPAVLRLLVYKNGVVLESQDSTTSSVNGQTTFSMSLDSSISPLDVLEVGIALIAPTPRQEGFPLSVYATELRIQSSSVPAVKCLKENTQPEIGIQYYDKELRSGGIIPIAPLAVTDIGSAAPLPIIDGDNPYSPYQRVNIHNRPPLWAYYYSLCIKETNIEYGWYTITAKSETTGKSELTFQNSIRGFTPQAGDFVRVIGKKINDLTDGTEYEVYAKSDYPEYRVFSVDLSTSKIVLNGVVQFSIVPSASIPVIIEVYRLKAKTPFYFEERFLPVGNAGLSNRFHSVPNPASGEQSQSAASPSAVPARIFMFGNSYTRYGDRFLVFSKSYSNGYESDYWNKGRPAIEVTNGGSKRLINGIRWGGQLFPNTFVNNMSVFDSGNYASTNQMFGVINAMRLRGFTLKIYQESNTSSAYLNRRSITNADGSEQLVLTDSLITQINPSISNQGTLHKGSVIMYGNSIYFFDAINGLMIRDAGNELFPISDYGAQKYFRDLAELTRTLGDDCDILSGFDEKTQQLFVSIVEHKDNYTTKSKTISFDETSNRWKFFHDNAITVGNNQQPIEMYSKMGNNMFMFLNGRCWESNELVDGGGNPVYLRLFGEDREFVLTGVSNVEPVKVKIFLAHSIHTNRIPNFVLIKTPISAMYPLGMESELLPGNYALREGVYYADIKRDAFTRGTPANPTARREQIAGGRPIRGNSMTYEMKWNGNSYVVVFSSGITVIPSEKS